MDHSQPTFEGLLKRRGEQWQLRFARPGQWLKCPRTRSNAGCSTLEMYLRLYVFYLLSEALVSFSETPEFQITKSF